ncbi:recombination regulator RecX [Limosilactobacillus sp. RRLNB_1_1]|uniref:Regulatory protein RecX n=1 Tax=Limosilactobacillus albertensis TaxID=2759752 RepID=A0A7W3TQ53_9LACO|nr:recombination regulator RecX [Limosilactobacillus albertensis]MBB1068857.1 recombination regulator RecX [Limosilactobacillus albertensis]MCD7118615.1 recombination regulator RecX [Limosilactobacillus albertensis]MCD7128236.1 recombination regulator RecX [Limosilactobacillus albertensis]
MAKISKIEAQKRKGRYNVYLDGKYAFPVAESVLIQFHLMKGTELDEKQIAAITTADQQAKAYSRMLDYLSYQMRTESDIIKKLKEIDTPEEFIEPILSKLRAQQLVDDHAYADSYVRTVMNTELKGPTVIRQHLRQKKIGENDIDDALVQFTIEDQAEVAKKLALKLFRRYRNQPERRRAQKVQQGLMTKGFTSNIYDMIKDEVVPQPDTEQENELLVKEAEKQWHRARRYQGYEREQHFKQAMYRKGFDLDDVQAWLDEQEL